jgi:hypothetical protein
VFGIWDEYMESVLTLFDVVGIKWFVGVVTVYNLAGRLFGWWLYYYWLVLL